MSQERTGAHIMVANLGEAFDDFTRLDQKNYGRQKRLELSIEEQGFLWAEDNTLVITSNKPHPRHLAHLTDSLGVENIQHTSPKTVSGRLSNDIADDTEVVSTISAFIQASEATATISAYSATKNYRKLVNEIKTRHPSIKTPELPLNEWIRDYADTKKGFRELCALLKGKIKIPDGIYCEQTELAAEITEYFLKNGTPCILKPNIGEDGMGQEKLFSGTTKDTVRETIQTNPYLSQGDLVVEELIETNDSRISPSGEWICTDNSVEFQYSGAQILSKSGATFEGFDIGPDVIPQSIDTQIKTIGHNFGNLIQDLGYRGYFDIDFILSKTGNLLAVESNLRRTGATHAHMIGKRIGGKNYYDNLYIRSLDVDSCVTQGLSTEDVFDRLERLFYRFDRPNSGVIITLSSGIEVGRLGYVVIGKSHDELNQLQETLRELLQTN